MTVHHFGEGNSLLNQFIAEIRDTDIQKDPMRFRRNIERIGEILSYEMSKSLNYKDKVVQTPFAAKKMALPNDKLVLCSVLRAGLPLHQGMLNYFDGAENAFISAYRHHRGDEDAFEDWDEAADEGRDLTMTPEQLLGALQAGGGEEEVAPVAIEKGSPELQREPVVHKRSDE